MIGICYEAHGVKDTISFSSATLNAGAELAVVLISLTGGTESVSFEKVSLNGGYFQVLGDSQGKDKLSFKNISDENSIIEVDEIFYYKENTENLSVDIDIEDAILKDSQFIAKGYNSTIAAQNINVDSDSYLELSTDNGDGNLEVDGATVSSSGRILIYGFNDGKETVKLQNISIESDAIIQAYAYGGDDTISIANISDEGVISIDGGEGKDSISVDGENVYVTGGDDSDTIIFSGKGSTVDATDNSDVITVKKDSNAVLDFGEGNLATVTATFDDVNVSEGKLQLTSGWNSSVDGTVKLSTLLKTFTLNDTTYSYDAEKKC